jgi:large subunit ribosomal protein L2
MTVTSFEGISKKKPEKALTEHQTSTGGRNHDGRITSRFRGGGHKQRYRLIDWKRNRIGIPATVARPSSTIPTAPRASRCSTTPTA